jgi:hypothetical protein
MTDRFLLVHGKNLCADGFPCNVILTLDFLKKKNLLCFVHVCVRRGGSVLFTFQDFLARKKKNFSLCSSA